MPLDSGRRRPRTAARLATAVTAAALLGGCAPAAAPPPTTATPAPTAARAADPAPPDVEVTDALPDVELAAAGSPAKISTLGQLNRWMIAAVQRQRSVSFQFSTLVGSTPPSTTIGVESWTRGVPSMAMTMVSDRERIQLISMPGASYELLESHPEAGGWTRFHEGSKDTGSWSWTGELILLRHRTNPGLMFPQLGRLAVTRSARPTIIDGSTCWTYQVRMTTRQAFAAQPASTRPGGHYQLHGSVTAAFSLDTHGLPHKVVETFDWGKQDGYREVTTLTGWGGPVIVQAPTDVPIQDSPPMRIPPPMT